MTLPLEDPQNPWIRTHGRSSADCGLKPDQMIDLLRKMGAGRYAYRMGTTAEFNTREGADYVIAWRPHVDDPDMPASEVALARRRARAVAEFLAGRDLSIRGAA
ncbi:hypothetical protein [Asticcacaulis taihuensis]|uniref:hypothetical protein n=1 Tax=Asticcacaulis taihuensis TaxID=260084 RepID=UPI0026F06DBD|nr:hypothetical protein [Asticcacaulis taihuensis]